MIIKKMLLALLVVISLTSCQEQQKTGFVDNSKLINDYQEKIDIESKYKIKDEAFKKKTDSIRQAFQLEYQVFQNKANKLSQKQQQEQSGEFNQKAQFLQQQIQLEQQQIQQQFNTEIDSAIAKTKRFVEDYAKTNNYTYILGKNEAGSVMYGEKSNDLTKLILDNLNGSYNKKEGSESKE